MANPRRAEFRVDLGQEITIRINYEVLIAAELITKTSLLTSLQSGGLSFTEIRALVWAGGQKVIGGLTPKKVSEHLSKMNQLEILKNVNEALVNFMGADEGDEVQELEEGEVKRTEVGTGADS